MNNFLLILIAALPIAALIAITVRSVKLANKGLSGKKILASNLAGFLIAAVLCGTFTFAVTAFAGDTETPNSSVESADTVQGEEAKEEQGANGLGLLAAALVTGLAGIGGGIAVAAGAPAAIAATSEDPKSFGKSLIFVALGESIALYGVVISILILNKV